MFTRKWTARSAFHQLNRDYIIELAQEASGFTPGHPKFLGALQNATTKLWKALAPEDREEYSQAAKDWSEKAPPKHIQSRYVLVNLLTACASYLFAILFA